ncbi:MAG: hypothetical protein CL799_10560 [Chromatiales bacterium]|nr:hypothetical protein [Chromatiales bacterium]
MDLVGGGLDLVGGGLGFLAFGLVLVDVTLLDLLGSMDTVSVFAGALIIVFISSTLLDLMGSMDTVSVFAGALMAGGPDLCMTGARFTQN